MICSCRKSLFWFLSLLILGLPGLATAQDQPAKESAPPSQEELEAEFAKKMTGVTLVGYFTIDGQKNPPREERYEISKTTKINDNQWLVQARIKYGDKDLTVPVPLNVDWAGDTPVMSLTDLTIPGLGTFTSRTMVYGDRYVGTWQHGKIGGHMYGRLERTEKSGQGSTE
jgi:hypothetical protein